MIAYQQRRNLIKKPFVATINKKGKGKSAGKKKNSLQKKKSTTLPVIKEAPEFKNKKK